MVDRLVVEDRIDSDHQPITVWIKGAEEIKKKRVDKRGKG